MKQCRSCAAVKHLGEFAVKRDRRRGTERRIHQCLECERARYRRIREKKRTEAQSRTELDELRYGKRGAVRRAWELYGKRLARSIVRAERQRERERARQERLAERLIGIGTVEDQRRYWREYQRYRRRHHPLRAAARRAVQRAVENDELLKPERCEGCERLVSPRGLHGHHHRGYEARHRLEVRWLCVRCHVEEEGGWGRSLAS